MNRLTATFQIHINMIKYVYICILQKHCAIYDIAWCIHDISWYVHLSIYDKTNIGRQTSRTESFFPFPFWEDCSRVPPSVRFRPHGGFVCRFRTFPRHSKNQFLAFPQQTAIWCCFFLHLSQHNLQHQVKKHAEHHQTDRGMNKNTQNANPCNFYTSFLACKL